MYNTEQKRYYTPQFSKQALVAMRRLAWALNLDMVQTVNEIVSFLSQLVLRNIKNFTQLKDKAF